MNRKKIAPVHPGEVLLEEFLKPLGISQYRLAKDVHVPPRRINEIVLHKRSVSADTALRLARFFGTSEQFWLNLQSQYDLDSERDRLGGRLLAEVVPFKQVRTGQVRTGLASGKTSQRARRTATTHAAPLGKAK